MTRRHSYPITPLALVGADVVLINLGFYLAWYGRYVLEIGAEIVAANFLPWSAYAYIQAILTGVLLLVLRLQGLYELRASRSWADEFGIIFWGTLVGIAV